MVNGLPGIYIFFFWDVWSASLWSDSWNLFDAFDPLDCSATSLMAIWRDVYVKMTFSYDGKAYTHTVYTTLDITLPVHIRIVTTSLCSLCRPAMI